MSCSCGLKNKKTLWNGGPEHILFNERLFWFCLAFEVFSILCFKLINTTGGINKFHLPSKEGMRSMRNFKFDQWVLFTIFKFDCFLGISSRFRHKRVTVRHVLENNKPIIFWMNVFFHNKYLSFFGLQK